MLNEPENQFSFTRVALSTCGRLKTNFLSVCLFLLLPAVVQAQFNYITNGGNIIITGYTGSGGAVVIPNMTNGYPVTSIGGNAFYMRGFITSLTIGTNVTSIGSSAFENCTGLTNITIPNSVTTIGDDAFHWCVNLAFVTIGTNVTSIGAYAFYGCGSLTSVTIPSSVTSIGGEAFACIPNAVWLPASLTAINVDSNNPTYCSVAGVLFNKSQTTLVQCPAGLAGSYTISNRVINIGDRAFYFCNSLTNVAIPSSVTNIGGGAFSECSSLTSITIGTNVTSIGYAAFFDCNSLTSVTIPASVTSLAEFAFGPCASLTAIDVDANNPAYCSVAGVLFNKSKTTLVQFPAGLAGSYTIPNGVTNIGDAAFYDCASLTNITAPSSITSIGGEYGFAFCYALTGLCLPGNAPSLGYDAFYATPVTIYYLPGTSGWVGTAYGGRPLVPAYPQISVAPKSRTDSVGSTATFSVTATGAAQLTYQWSKDGTNLLDTGTILGATNATVTINNLHLQDAGNYLVVVTNVFGRVSTGAVLTVTLSSPATDFNYLTNGGSITINGYKGPGGAVIIPDSISGLPVTSVAGFAFYSSSSLTRVTIPNSVTSIAAYAFYSCTSLTNVVIGSSVTNLGSPAFSSCASLSAITVDNGNPVYASEAGILFNKTLTTLIQYPMGLAGSYTISNRVTAIGNGAFSSCAGLTRVTIPSSIHNISDSAFNNCTGLTNVIIPNSVTNIGSMAFMSCSSLASITIPNGVLSLGDNAFNYCTGLTNISIPGSVITIGNNAFYGCSGLTGVAIPSSVTSIGNSAFGGCASLVAINVDTNNPAYSSVMGVLFNKSQTTLFLCPVGKTGTYAISNGCTSIADSAFSGCSSLTQITIPDSVTNIGIWALSGCSSLTSIRIPNNVTSIGMGMFENCMNLTSVTLPNSVTNIGNMAFSSCSSLTNISIPASVVSFGFSAFGWCTSLKAVYFLGNAPSGMNVFYGDNAAVAYYLSGTTGWGSYIGGMGPDSGGIPTALWSPSSSPGLQLPGTRFGGHSNQFGFNITGSSNQEVVVEACTALANPVWLPIYTNTLTGGSISFSDPNWTNYPGRFYRVRSQ
jgi:hypothetical protein